MFVIPRTWKLALEQIEFQAYLFCFGGKQQGIENAFVDADNTVIKECSPRETSGAHVLRL